ncbi:winged helix DNA-binding domain-containing protein [Miltoncostaea marina]|uniref:winged helix DNA-binding domain-containing protein n=1 Tax=Miltoncostaea marina TaxID=2843215 RepID=UPI001C3E76DE|nr:winged helix DNA-binding domain-containing protein [Miltoncostaea marina]
MSPPSEAVLRRWWARSGGLWSGRERDVPGAVRRCAGVQAQDWGAARLQVRARAPALAADDVDRALAEGAVVRTWAMRGTLQLLPAEGIRDLLALFAEPNARRYARRRAELGLEPVLDRAVAATREALADRGPLRRHELVGELRRRGVPIGDDGQAAAHLMMVAAARGIACRGPEGPGGRPTLAPLDALVPPAPPRDPDAVLGDLALAHARAFGPVDERDLIRWSGLPAALARRGFALAARRLRRVATPLGPRWAPRGERPPAAPRGPRVRLLGAFETHLLGHADRSPLLAPADDRRVASGGVILPTVLVDGRVAGTWRAERRAGRVALRVAPFAPLGDGVAEALAPEAAAVGRFLGLEATLEAEDPVGGA